MIKVEIDYLTEVDKSVPLPEPQNHFHFHPVVVDEALIVTAAFGPEIAMDEPNSDCIGPKLSVWQCLQTASVAQQVNEFGHVLMRRAANSKPVWDSAAI